MVLIFILIYFGGRDIENQQYYEKKQQQQQQQRKNNQIGQIKLVVIGAIISLLSI